MKKIMAIFMCLTILVSLFFSVFFIANNTHHDCAGESCPICEQIQAAKNTIQRFSLAILIVVAIFLFCNQLQIERILYRPVLFEETPIRLKVKLQN